MSVQPDWSDEFPEWMSPPRAEGWLAEDLDRLPDFPYHVELHDGALVFMMSPQRSWHALLIRRLANGLENSTPESHHVDTQMTVKLDKYNRMEPDVVIVTTPFDPDRTGYDAADVVLAVEVVSPESAHRDRRVKTVKYAQAGIPHYWRIEDEQGLPVTYRYELDPTTGQYAPVGIDRGIISCSLPFDFSIDLATTPGR